MPTSLHSLQAGLNDDLHSAFTTGLHTGLHDTLPSGLAASLQADFNPMNMKRELYNEFFDLDNNQIKIKDSAVGAVSVLEHEVPDSLKDNSDDGSDTESVTSSEMSNASTDSSLSSSQTNSFLADAEQQGDLISRDVKVPSKSGNGELSPKSQDGDGVDKIYHCEFCSKSFTRSWNYQRHVLIHSGRKPHKCEMCPKAFVLAAHLKIHMRIHTGKDGSRLTFTYIMNFTSIS